MPLRLLFVVFVGLLPTLAQEQPFAEQPALEYATFAGDVSSAHPPSISVVSLPDGSAIVADTSPRAVTSRTPSGGILVSFVPHTKLYGIDPASRRQSTVASFDGQAEALKIGPSGHVYVAGRYAGDGSPVTEGALYADRGDGFLLKLDTASGEIVYGTRLLGDVYGLAVASDGSVALAGEVSSDFETTPRAVKSAVTGRACRDFSGESIPCPDAFAIVLDPRGTLVFATLLGGLGSELATAVAFGPNGNAVVIGRTTSRNFPAYEGGLFSGVTPESDVFVVGLSSDGTQMQTAVRWGGSGDDHALDAAQTSDGGLVVVGTTSSVDLPVAADAMQPVNAGDRTGLSCGWTRKAGPSRHPMWAPPARTDGSASRSTLKTTLTLLGGKRSPALAPSSLS